jgi:hypothetical protein
MVSWDLIFGILVGWITFLPVLVLSAVLTFLYTSVLVGDQDPVKFIKAQLSTRSASDSEKPHGATAGEKSRAMSGGGESVNSEETPPPTTTQPQKQRQGWLTVRRTFFEAPTEGSYMNQMVRSFLDARSKDPKRTRPRDTFYAVLKGTVLFLYEDDSQSDCWAAIEMSSYDVGIYYPTIDSGDSAGTGESVEMLDGELFAKRNAIVLRVRQREMKDVQSAKGLSVPPSVTKNIMLGAAESDYSAGIPPSDGSSTLSSIGEDVRDPLKPVEEAERDRVREDAFDQTRPWFLFIRPNIQMEDWYHSLLHTSLNPSETTILQSLQPVFSPSDMDILVKTLDSQSDPIPMRWLNALIGRLFFGVYRTARIEEFIITRLRRKLAKVKRPSYLSDIVVREASVGNAAPTLSKPMLKELTKEGETSVELGLHFKGEIRIIVEATATINLGARFKTYEVKLVLAIVLKEIEGNLLVRVKSPPSNRAWYAFTSMPKIELEVLPVVSERQIKWSMILKPIESMIRDVVSSDIRVVPLAWS